MSKNPGQPNKLKVPTVNRTASKTSLISGTKTMRTMRSYYSFFKNLSALFLVVYCNVCVSYYHLFCRSVVTKVRF